MENGNDLKARMVNGSDQDEDKKPIENTNNQQNSSQEVEQRNSIQRRISVDNLMNVQGEYQKKYRKKVIILIAVVAAIVIGAALAVILALALSSKSLPGLVFTRSFALFDTYHYKKQGNLCVSITSTIRNTNNCQNVQSDYAFNVVNISDYAQPPPFINYFSSRLLEAANPAPQKQKYKLITILLYIKNLTYSNETASLQLENPSIEVIETNSTNFSSKAKNLKAELYHKGKLSEQERVELLNQASKSGDDVPMPIVVFSMFENGTIYSVYKPVNINPTTFAHMVDLIKGFSPNLAEDTYYKKKAPLQSSFRADSNQTSSNYTEVYGNQMISPNFTYNSSITTVKKTVFF